MGDLAVNSLLLPAMMLALLGWLVPRALSLVFPEGVRPLMLLAFVATLVMFALSVLMFLGLYLVQGVTLSVLFVDGALPGIVHFGRLGLLSAMMWGPIMVLSVAGLPKNWVEETW